MDTPGYHPVQNPNPNPFYEDSTPHVQAPTMIPLNTNQQGLRGFTIPTGRGPAWEQQLCDTMRAQYHPARQARPPLALEEQVPSGSSEPR